MSRKTSQSVPRLRVRSAEPADAEALAEIFQESWKSAYLGIIPHLHLEAMVRRRNVTWWRRALDGSRRTLILEVAGTPAGYANWGKARIRGPYQGEIYELYVAPIYQGLGFGEYLFEAARHAMDEAQLRGLIVWAITQNEGACAFYRRRGGRAITRASERFGSVKLEKTAFGWPDVVPARKGSS